MKEITPSELKIMIEDMKQRSEERHADYKERDLKFMSLLEKLDAKADMIVAQTTKTNGRVSKHDWYFKLLWWATGAIWVLIVLGSPLIYKLHNMVLDQKLKEYVIEHK